jgi:7,8-dihydropterin-6-yl-methyl-4-(beta-D-ribofuranosyl)aminobenzene 5'-phosphate synthase
LKTKLFNSWNLFCGWGSSRPHFTGSAPSPGQALARHQVKVNCRPELKGPSEMQKISGVWVTVLVENTVQGRGLQAEHGLSFLIRTEGECVLFDTGQTDLLLKNAAALEVSLEEVKAIALSHGHYDHTGGLKAARTAAPSSRIYVHPAALGSKFAGNSDGSSRPVGLSDSAFEILNEAKQAITWTEKPTEIASGVFVTGTIPRTTSFEGTGGRFFLDEACTQPDLLLDDQALFFDTEDGVVVLLGCGHAGVVNTVEYVRQLTSHRPINAVIGGFHLLEASAERMTETIDAVRRWNLQRLAPAHCTGIAALIQLWSAFPDRCSPCPVGTSLGFRPRNSPKIGLC